VYELYFFSWSAVSKSKYKYRRGHRAGFAEDLGSLNKIEMIFILITYCTSISKPNHE